MPTSFDLTQIDELRVLAQIMATLNDLTDQLADRTVIIGATARDVILHHVYGLPITRATADLDVAVAMRNWRAFEALRARLIESGSTRDARMVHRFKIHGWTIDIVPFGGVEHNGRIVWPETEAQMTVAGLDEASRHALEIRLPGSVRAFIAAPPALLMLKLIAWDERHVTQPRHDAVDIRTLLDSYAAEWNQERLYRDADDLLQKFGYDNSLAAAALLGRDAAAIAGKSTLERLRTILDRELTNDTLLLAADMGQGTETNVALIEALFLGLSDEGPDADR